MLLPWHILETWHIFSCAKLRGGHEAVANKEADFGVLPLENSSAGQVGDVYDLLTRYDNTIVGEYYLPVRHCLLGLKGADIDKIQTVYSHPQGLMQCGNF